MFKNKILLITGGTGSFGNAVLNRFLDSDIKEIRIFSRDEKKQDDMRHRLNNSKVKFYIADYPWYSTRMWANTIQKTLNSKPIKTAPLWLLRIIGYIGDVIKKVFRIDPLLTTFRLHNMLTGGVYPMQNTKDVCGNLPYDLNKSVYETAKWMYDNQFIKHEPKETLNEQ